MRTLPQHAVGSTAGFFDLGLCARPNLCGRFRAPTLCNVSSTGPYFHNARFAALEDTVAVNNDLPATYRTNVQQVAPLRRPCQPPAPRSQGVAGIVAFLRTLSDGLMPAQQVP